MSYGSAGNGSVHHLTMAVFAARAGIDLLHVPYKGGTGLVAALLGGEVQAGWDRIPNSDPPIRLATLKGFGTRTAGRWSPRSGGPAPREQGYPGLHIRPGNGPHGPAR